MISMAKPEPHEGRKKKILEAFRRRFAHFGQKKTSVDEVASELGMSKKTIYSLFPSKEKIFYSIVYEIASRKKGEIKRQLSKIKNPKKKLLFLADMAFKHRRKKCHSCAFDIEFKEEIASLAVRHAYDDLLTEIVQDAMDKGQIEKMNAQVLVSALRAVVLEGAKLYASEENPKDIRLGVHKIILKMLKK